jgi:23S rRNA (guanosine2251-2'-O)-methyltransferase
MIKNNTSDQIIGIHPVMEAINSGRSIEKVFIEKSTNGLRLFEILKTCRKMKIPVSLVHQAKLDSMSRGNTQGVIARIAVRNYATIEDLLNIAEQNPPALFVIPEGVEDPHNLGAIIRSALCSGVHGVILPNEGSAGLTEGTAKASAGAIEHMKVARVSNMPGALKTLKAAGVRLIGFEAGNGKKIWDTKLTVPTAIVLGGENKGIRPHIRRELDELVHIPIQGAVNSLNVSATAAVALFEAVRQRENRRT